MSHDNALLRRSRGGPSPCSFCWSRRWRPVLRWQPRSRNRRRRPIEIDLSPLDAARGGDIAVAIADRDLLDGALRHLEPEWRAIVVMHYYLGMPLPDVAATLGIPLGTAKSRLHRSLAAMRADLNIVSSLEATELPRGQIA